MENSKTLSYLKIVWPTVYRIINDGLYFIFSVTKAGIRIAINQIKGRTP